ncbi:MAG: 50S ribosomal protein L28 [Rickettsiales bacterium]|nr:50S ribosomal protein L28 [Rickettsiales bacterium]
MTRSCELTGMKSMFGQNVSHSNRKTKTQFLPNLCNVSLISEALNRKVKLKITKKTLRSVDINGGLDGFLLSRRSTELTTRAKELRKKIEVALASKK